jgi:hypothetical protein
MSTEYTTLLRKDGVFIRQPAINTASTINAMNASASNSGFMATAGLTPRQTIIKPKIFSPGGCAALL